MLNKNKLIQDIIAALNGLHKNAVAATQLAHDSATDKENVAENKYDTLGLEAGYLAFGQSQRVAECASDLEAFKSMQPLLISSGDSIKVGALVTIIDEQGKTLILFLGPAAGGLKFDVNGHECIVVTPGAPLGKALLGKYLDDEFELRVGDKVKLYCVEHIE